MEDITIMIVGALIVLTQLGVVGGFIKAQRQISDLHKWHDVHDEEGVKIWYIRRSLIDGLDEIGKQMHRMERVSEKQMQVLEMLATQMQTLGKLMENNQ